MYVRRALEIFTVTAGLTVIVFLFILFINPSTYHGIEGHNIGWTTLAIIGIPIVVLLLINYKRRNKKDLFALGITLIILIILLGGFGLMEKIDNDRLRKQFEESRNLNQE